MDLGAMTFQHATIGILGKVGIRYAPYIPSYQVKEMEYWILEIVGSMEL